jgi:hypothetical protein
VLSIEPIYLLVENDMQSPGFSAVTMQLDPGEGLKTNKRDSGKLERGRAKVESHLRPSQSLPSDPIAHQWALRPIGITAGSSVSQIFYWTKAGLELDFAPHQ